MNYPRFIPILLAFSAAACAVLAADEKVAAEIDVLRGSYQRSAKAALKASDDKYSAGLEVLYKRYTKEAKLEAAMQVRNEIAFAKLGGVWRWKNPQVNLEGYISIHRDLTVMDIRAKLRGKWESTDAGLKISWDNNTSWEITNPTTDGRVKVIKSPETTFERE